MAWMLQRRHGIVGLVFAPGGASCIEVERIALQCEAEGCAVSEVKGVGQNEELLLDNTEVMADVTAIVGDCAVLIHWVLCGVLQVM